MNDKKDWFYEYINVGGADLNYSSGILGTSLFSEDGVEIVDTLNMGKALYINGALQVCEKDEFIYSEMIVKPALEAQKHKDLLKVLLIGGGDGGALREIRKYENVALIDFVDISKTVVTACKEYLNTDLNESLKDLRVTTTIMEGSEFIRASIVDGATWDVIIVDSSDPIGESAKLFTYQFLLNCKKCLNKDGILTFQAQSYLTNLKFVKQLLFYTKDIFNHSYYYHIPFQSYSSGNIGFIICSPNYEFLDLLKESENGKFYSLELFKASTVLPPYFHYSNKVEVFNDLCNLYNLDSLFQIRDLELINRYLNISGEPENFFFDHFSLSSFIIKREGSKLKYGLRLLTLIDEKKNHDLKNKECVRDRFLHSKILRIRRQYNLSISGFEWDLSQKTFEVFLFSEDLPKLGIEEFPELYANRPENFSNRGFISFKSKWTELIDCSLHFFDNIHMTSISQNSKDKKMKFIKMSDVNKLFTEGDMHMIDGLKKIKLNPFAIRFDNCLDYELHLSF